MADDQNSVSLNINSNTGQNPLPEDQNSSSPVVPEMPSVIATESVFSPSPENNAQNHASAEPKAKTLYSSDDPNNNQVDLSKAGFDLNIEQKVPATEVEMNGSGGDIVDKIVASATANKDQEAKILEELEQMDPSLDMDIPIAPLAEKKVKTAKTVFFGVLLTSICVLAYLFLNPSNGAASLSKSTLDPLSTQKQELVATQSELVASHFFIANTALKSVAENVAKLVVDLDIAKSEFSNYSEKSNAERNLEDYRDNIVDSLKIAEKEISDAQKLLLENKEVESNLLLYLSDKESKSANLIEKSELREVLGIYRNTEILSQIKQLNFNAENEEFVNQLQPLLANLKSSDIGRIAFVQSKRISWSYIISELERITQKVDPGMNNIIYNGYTFDAEQNRVSVTGQIQTADEKTFTKITLLVDSLNEPDSPFENANNTSFSKNPSEENGFTSSIRLDFNIK